MKLELVFFGVPLLLLIFPSVLRSRRWLLGYVVLVGGALAAVEITHQWVTSRPDYIDGAAGAGLGEALFVGWELSFVFGLALRCVLDALFFAARVRRTSLGKSLSVVFAVVAAAFAFTTVVLVVPLNLQWYWLIGRFMLRFSQKAAPYFIVLWAVASLVVAIFPLFICRAQQAVAADRTKTAPAERRRWA